MSTDCRASERGNGSLLLAAATARGFGGSSPPGGPLRDPEGDVAFFDALRANLPDSVEVVEVDTHAEDPLPKHAREGHIDKDTEKPAQKQVVRAHRPGYKVHRQGHWQYR